MKNLIWVVMLTGLGVTNAFAGKEGGGGQGIVCIDAPTGKLNVELLDLYEWRSQNPDMPLITGTGDLAADVDAAIIRLRYAYPSDRKGKPDPDLFVYRLREQAIQFLDPENKKLLRRHGETIAPTNDAYSVAWPVNCPPQQIVNYQAGDRIWMNEDYYDAMNEINQAALIVHEALYSLLWNWGQEDSSVRVRRAVGFVFSGNSFSAPPKVVWPNTKGIFMCSSQDVLGTSTRIEVYPEEGKIQSSEYHSYKLMPLEIGGNRLMGLPKTEFDGTRLYNTHRSAAEMLMKGCKGHVGTSFYDDF